MITSMSSALHGQNPYQASLDQLIADPALAGASLGLCVLDAKTGKEQISYQADLARIPASTMKVVTTRYAIELLGLDFRFKTYFGYTGEIDSVGVLHGDLVVQGGGDPTLGSKYFKTQECTERWFMALKEAGIRAVSGDLVVLDNAFQGPPLAGSTAIEDGGNYFGAGAFGVNYRDNTFEVELRSGSAGEIAEVLAPTRSQLRLISHVVSSTSSADQAYIYGMPGSEVMHIYGSIPQHQNGFKIKAAMPNPALVLAEELHSYFETRGIEVQGGNVIVQDENNVRFKVLNVIESPSLTSILNLTNEKSINLNAASLFKAIGKVRLEDGSFSGSWRAISQFRKEKGQPNIGMFIADGSGLSRLNTLTARQLAECTLPMSGDLDLALTGGWKAFAGSDAVRVKSGYIGGVRSYAGRIRKNNGDILCFSVIVNHGNGSASEIRQVIERWALSLSR